MKNSFKLATNGNEVLIGLDLYNKPCVSCWTDDYNPVWIKKFNTEDEARTFFDKLEAEEG